MSKNYKISATLKGHDRASSTFARAGRRISRSLGGALRRVKGLGKALTSLPVLGGVLGGALGVGKLVSWVKEFAAAGDTIAKTSKAAGFGAAFFQRLAHAADLSGVSASAFAGAMGKFAESLGGLKANQGRLVTFLRVVSPALLKTLKATKSSRKALLLYLGAMSKVKDPALRAKMATAAFGQSGSRMAILAGQGADGIKRMMDEADRLHIVLGGDALKASEDLTDEMARLGGEWKGLKAVFGTAFIKAALPYMKRLTKWLADNNDKIGAMASSFATDLVEGIKSVAEALPSIAKSLAKIAKVIGKIVSAAADIPAPILALLGGKFLLRGGGAAAAAAASGETVAGGAAAKTIAGRALGATVGTAAAVMVATQAVGPEDVGSGVRARMKRDPAFASEVAKENADYQSKMAPVFASVREIALRLGGGLAPVTPGSAVVRFDRGDVEALRSALSGAVQVNVNGPPGTSASIVPQGATGHRTQGR